MQPYATRPQPSRNRRLRAFFACNLRLVENFFQKRYPLRRHHETNSEFLLGLYIKLKDEK